MAASSSLAAELLEAINMPNLKAIPSYLSEDDALTVNLFLQSEYARDFAIDIRNIHWGGEIHHSHVFDIYCVFSASKDPVTVRLDMLRFVANNQKRYDWNAHLFLRMNQLTLDNWIRKMTHWDNCADPLAIYALSDMLGIHTTIITKTKPWTTVSGDYQGTIDDLLRISKVNLVYLGENRFARLWQKDSPNESSYIGPNFNLNVTPLAVTPSKPATPKKRRKTKPKPPTQEELTTAETLLELRESVVQKEVLPSVNLPDAMDKIVGHLDVVNPPKMPFHDAVDLICQPAISVETVTPIPEESVRPALCVETQSCSVVLTRLDQILRDELVKVTPTSATDLPEGQYFTRSRSAKPKVRQGKLPRRASTGVSYDEPLASPMAKPQCSVPKRKPSRMGPTQDRIDSRSKNTVAPSVRLPGVKADPRDKENSDSTDVMEDEPSPVDSTDDNIPLAKLRGKFETTSHVLEKKTESRNYKCRMCPKKVSSCRELTLHHQTKHGIIYCKICNKAFNNPRTREKHMYEHCEKKFSCKRCGAKFFFESQLKTHKLTHRKANQRCMYHKCGKVFKSKSDLNRHAALHTKPWLVCPDCDNYKTKDKRNFESHRFSHSKIERYFCKNCGAGFVHNTQKLRHVKSKSCK